MPHVAAFMLLVACCVLRVACCLGEPQGILHGAWCTLHAERCTLPGYREYREYSQALLVHDPSLPSAAMSANVETGFFDDPEEYPGEYPQYPSTPPRAYP